MLKLKIINKINFFYLFSCQLIVEQKQNKRFVLSFDKQNKCHETQLLIKFVTMRRKLMQFKRLFFAMHQK